MLLRRIIWLGFAIALLIGSLMSAVQQWQAVPIILAAEQFEGQKVAAVSTPDHDHAGHDHASAHVHDEEAWAPQDGIERLGWTWVANVLLAFSLALLLLCCLGAWTWQRGLSIRPMRAALLTAAAGWLCFYAWPSLGLPPEIPGMDAARLGSRQGWWLLAAGCAALACLCLALGRKPGHWLAAAALLALPHLVGAPHLLADPFAGFSADAATQLRDLAMRFQWASLVHAAVQWLAIGLLGGLAFEKGLLPMLSTHSRPGGADLLHPIR